MKTIQFLIVSCALIGLSACEKEPAKEEVRTVDWYLANRDALKAKEAECQNNPGIMGPTPNCINAASARHSLLVEEQTRETVQKLEPIDWEKHWKETKRPPTKTNEEIEAERAKQLEEFKKMQIEKAKADLQRQLEKAKADSRKK
jgi:hypothetical protein